MSDGSKISWLARPGTKPATWNPIRASYNGKTGVHCEHASEGCRHCYAETGWNRRFGTGLSFTRQSRDKIENDTGIGLSERILHNPLHWTKPRTVFVCSTSDLFGEWVPDEMIDRIIAVAALCPRHTFILLTKRADRMRAYFEGRRANFGRASEALMEMELWHEEGELQAVSDTLDSFDAGGRPQPNLWLGVTTENQTMADRRIPDLLATPAAIRFVSCEPMLGAIDLERCGAFKYYPGGRVDEYSDVVVDDWVSSNVDWVICGGESGPHARPMHPDWARSLRDQCTTAGVPFFFKQWGEWLGVGPGQAYVSDCHGLKGWGKDCFSLYVGRTAAGDLLDGEHLHAWPEVQS